MKLGRDEVMKLRSDEGAEHLPPMIRFEVCSC